MKYRLIFKYVYTFYNNGDECFSEVFEQEEDIGVGARFLLHDQEDGSFLISDISRDHLGDFAVLTFPNKDNIIVRSDRACELAYDEYYSAMGDNNHNVYEGTVRLSVED